MDSMLHLLSLNSLTCPPGGRPCQWRCGQSWEGGREVCKMGSTICQYASLFPTGGWERGLGRLLSIQDTFIFPESNSASGSGRPRRWLFSTWRLERDQQVKLLRNLLLRVWPLLERSVTFWLGTGDKVHLCYPHGSRTLSASLALLVFFSLEASTSQQPSSVDLPPTPELDWMETGQPLTFIGHQVQWIS